MNWNEFIDEQIWLHDKFGAEASPELHYKGIIKTTDLENIQAYKGDIVVEESTQKAFVYLNDCWLPISLNENDNEKNDDISDEPRKVRSICSHCGGVLVPNLHSEITVCAYCDCANSTFIYKTDPEFNKI